jgi:hypothetical protein
MNQRPDHKDLLADVLAEESRAGLHTAILGETLRHVRRRRQWRQVRRAGAVLATVLIVGLAVLRNNSSRTGSVEIAKPQSAPPGYELVLSQPMNPAQVVSTQPLAAERFITGQNSVAQVSTRTGGFREVGDEELLTLAEPQIAALVRRGPHQAELVFVSHTGSQDGVNQN